MSLHVKTSPLSRLHVALAACVIAGGIGSGSARADAVPKGVVANVPSQSTAAWRFSEHPAPPLLRRADVGRERVSPEARSIADWIARSHDNGRAPFVIVDKKNARVLVFDTDARLKGSAPVLLGFARGDDSIPGIGERKLSDIKPSERTTPAGRFVAEEGRNLQGEQIVWVDYDAAVSMHRVRATNPRERRLERLATSTVSDNRISWGCINVPAAFFDANISPIFGGGRTATVYVLPEVHSLQQVFPAYAADARLASEQGVPGQAASLR